MSVAFLKFPAIFSGFSVKSTGIEGRRRCSPVFLSCVIMVGQHFSVQLVLYSWNKLRPILNSTKKKINPASIGSPSTYVKIPASMRSILNTPRNCLKKRRRLARIIVWCCFVSGAGWLFLKDWIPGQASLPGMTRCIVWGCLFWAASTINTSPRHHLTTKAPFHHFTFPPFHLKNTFPPFHENSWARKETKNAYTC